MTGLTPWSGHIGNAISNGGADAIIAADQEVVVMMYPYMTFDDGTVVTHSQLLGDEGCPKVQVHFERACELGFDSARCELPSYVWTAWEGHFSDDEIRAFKAFLASNAHLLFRFAATGGAKVA